MEHKRKPEEGEGEKLKRGVERREKKPNTEGQKTGRTGWLKTPLSRHDSTKRSRRQGRYSRETNPGEYENEKQNGTKSRTQLRRETEKKWERKMENNDNFSTISGLACL